MTHLDERSAANAEVAVPQRSDAKKGINDSRIKNVVVLAKLDRSSH